MSVVVDKFLRDILAIYVLTNAFSDTLEKQISKFVYSASTIEVPHGDNKFSKPLKQVLPIFICSMLAYLDYHPC